MNKISQFQIQVDRGIKTEAEAILAHIPNAETRAAMEEDLSGGKRFQSATELFTDIEAGN